MALHCPKVSGRTTRCRYPKANDDPLAPVSVTVDITLDSVMREIISTGGFDISTYRFDDELVLTRVKDTFGNDSSDDQRGPSELLENAIRQLQVFIDESDTRCTMQMLGFDSLF